MIDANWWQPHKYVDTQWSETLWGSVQRSEWGSRWRWRCQALYIHVVQVCINSRLSTLDPESQVHSMIVFISRITSFKSSFTNHTSIHYFTWFSCLYYCQTILHHLTNQQYDRIRRYLNRQFSGVLGIGFNDWSQAIGPLGFVVKVVGEGTGSAHAEIIPLWVSEFGWGSQKWLAAVLQSSQSSDCSRHTEPLKCRSC